MNYKEKYKRNKEHYNKKNEKSCTRKTIKRNEILHSDVVKKNLLENKKEAKGKMK